VKNIGFIVTLGSDRFLHVGDTMATPDDLAAYDLPAEKIDFAMIPFWHLLDDDWPEMEQRIRAGRYVGMHLPAVDSPASYFGESGSLKSLVGTLKQRYPDLLLIEEPLQEWNE